MRTDYWGGTAFNTAWKHVTLVAGGTTSRFFDASSLPYVNITSTLPYISNVASGDSAGDISWLATTYSGVPTATWGTVPIASMNGLNDGQWIACDYLSWMDLCAYADWAGLRPMTELELEKACRGGGVSATAGDYPWGSTAAYTSTAYTLSNAGAINESIARPRSGPRDRK